MMTTDGLDILWIDGWLDVDRCPESKLNENRRFAVRRDKCLFHHPSFALLCGARVGHWRLFACLSVRLSSVGRLKMRWIGNDVATYGERTEELVSARKLEWETFESLHQMVRVCLVRWCSLGGGAGHRGHIHVMRPLIHIFNVQENRFCCFGRYSPVVENDNSCLLFLRMLLIWIQFWNSVNYTSLRTFLSRLCYVCNASAHVDR